MESGQLTRQFPQYQLDYLFLTQPHQFLYLCLAVNFLAKYNIRVNTSSQICPYNDQVHSHPQSATVYIYSLGYTGRENLSPNCAQRVSEQCGTTEKCPSRLPQERTISAWLILEVFLACKWCHTHQETVSDQRSNVWHHCLVPYKSLSGVILPVHVQYQQYSPQGN